MSIQLHTVGRAGNPAWPSEGVSVFPFRGALLRIGAVGMYVTIHSVFVLLVISSGYKSLTLLKCFFPLPCE